MKRSGWIAVGLLLAACISLAATTYTAPLPRSSRTDWMTNRYSAPAEGLLVVDWTSSDVTDESASLDTQLSGYLERIVWEHDGNDETWTITVADSDGVTLFSDATANAVTDPCSYAVTSYGALPFTGGLTVSIADADDGTGSEVAVRLYIREAWRQ